MQMTDESWYVVRNTRGCTGFVGPGSKPVPLSEAEVERLGVETAAVQIDISVGDTVRIADGSMEGFMGEVLEINNERKAAQAELDNLLAQIKVLSKNIGGLMKEGKKEEAELAAGANASAK